MTSMVIAIVLVSDSSMRHKVIEILDLMMYKQHITKNDPIPTAVKTQLERFQI